MIEFMPYNTLCGTTRAIAILSPEDIRYIVSSSNINIGMIIKNSKGIWGFTTGLIIPLEELQDIVRFLQKLEHGEDPGFKEVQPAIRHLDLND